MSINYNVVVINQTDDEMKDKYKNHNVNYKADVGVDLFMPNKIIVPPKSISFKLGTGIKASGFVNQKKTSYMIFPRSSMGAKTPLRLCNSIGLVDPDYTGELFIFVDNMNDSEYTINRMDRLVQLVGPNHQNPSITLVDKLENTERGEKGIGSSGK